MRENSFGNILQYILLVIMCVALAVLVFLNYRANTAQQKQLEAETASAEMEAAPAQTAEPEATPEPVRNTETVTLAFAGDIVAHKALTTAAESVDGDTTRYDYSDELAGVVSVLQQADLSACTYVGTIRDGGDYANYEMSPDIAAALAYSGFQIVNAATDRILDNGLEGVTDTASILSGEGLEVIGIHESETDTDVCIRDVNGIQVAFLSYTYGTDGNSEADYPWAVDVFNTDYMTDQSKWDEDKITSDIAAAKEAGADIIACNVYWWEDSQYMTEAREKETEFADYLCESGVDIIIGSGIKMPQQIETKVVERSDGTKANCVICYSLSNLLSCFTDENTELSAVAMIDISRDIDTDDVWVSGVSYEPMFMMDASLYPASEKEEDAEDEDGESDEDETADDETEEEETAEDEEEDLTPVSYSLSVLDAYAEIDAYENDDSSLTDTAYAAVKQGVAALQGILGAEYDTANGGVTMDYPY